MMDLSRFTFCWRLWVFALSGVSFAASLSSDVHGKLYWSDSGLGKIRRSNLDGTNVEDVIVLSSLTHPRGIAIVSRSSHIYWAEFFTRRIMRATLTGENVEVVALVPRGPEGLALDMNAGLLYWTDVDGRIQRSGLHGENVETISRAVYMHREDLALDVSTGHVFWPTMDLDYASIQSVGPDGATIRDLVDTESHGEEVFVPRGIAIDALHAKLYWTDADAVKRANLDGSNVESVVAHGARAAAGIAVDPQARKMYWVDRGNSTLDGHLDKISRANLDGTEVEVLPIEGHMEPRCIIAFPASSVN